MLVTSTFFSFHSIVKATFHPESVSVLMSILITGCPVAGPAETSGKKTFFSALLLIALYTTVSVFVREQCA